MNTSRKWGIFVITLLLVALPLLVACGDDETESPSTAAPTGPATPAETVEPTELPAEDVKIKIGLLTDQTGPASQALIPVDMALTDVIRYFNENDLISGAELEVIPYDTQYDPAKDVTGYELLKSKGADLMCAGVVSSPIVNKPSADADEMVIFSLTAAFPMYAPEPGYVFCINIPTDASVNTMMNWLAENDPNFPADRPAKVGAIGAKGPYADSIQGGLEAYCAANENFEWVKGFLVDYAAVEFASQIETLKDCDYVMPPSTGGDIPGFMKQYRQAEGKGRFLGTDAQLAYLGLLVQGAGYEVMDGMIFALPYTWWNEEGEVVELAKQALSDYHSEGEAGGLKESGGAYRGGFTQWFGTVSIIAGAINEVGAENFDSKALHDYCIGFSINLDGNEWSYSDNPEASSAEQRTSWASLGMFEIDADGEDLVRISDGWVPVLMTP